MIVLLLSSTQDVQSLREVLDQDDFEFRFDVGICDPSYKINLSDRDRIVESLATYYTVVRVKADSLLVYTT